MKLKPSVWLDMIALLGKKTSSYIGKQRINSLILDESDYLLIEDQSGRMKVVNNEIMNPANFITGSVVALKGRITTNGCFEASDFCFPGIPSIRSMPDGYEHLANFEENKDEISLFENLQNREFVCFVSGLEFGNMENKISVEILNKFFKGLYGTQDERELNSRVSRIIWAGSHIGEEKDINEVIKGSYRRHDENEKIYSSLSNSIEQFEAFLASLSKVWEIDIIPGENDISGAFLPQQPFNVAMFPQLLDNNNILFTTNPHSFSLNGLNFLGSSGQNIDDICRFKDMSEKTQLDILEETLEMRHMAPTCPDTLRSYPFEVEDPLTINEAPNVYFSCNSP